MPMTLKEQIAFRDALCNYLLSNWDSDEEKFEKVQKAFQLMDLEQKKKSVKIKACKTALSSL